MALPKKNVVDNAPEEVKVVEAELVEDGGIPFDADENYSEPQTATKAVATQTATKAVATQTQTQAVATQTQTTAVAPTTGSGGAVASLAEEGFEGVSVGFGTFPQVVLVNEGHFESSEGWDMGDGFDCLLMGSKVKYILKNTKCLQKDEDFAYSYDKLNDVNGTPLQEYIDKWDTEGWGHEFKEYREVPAQVVGGDWDGELIVLSVPSSSIKRFNGHLVRSKMRGKDVAEVLTRVCVGDKITNVDYPFYPWAFK